MNSQLDRTQTSLTSSKLIAYFVMTGEVCDPDTNFSMESLRKERRNIGHKVALLLS